MQTDLFESVILNSQDKNYLNIYDILFNTLKKLSLNR